MCDSRHHFRVDVGGYCTTYLITGGQAATRDDEEDEDDTADFTPDQLLTGSTMEWVKDDSGGGCAAKKLVVTSASDAKERRMVGDLMQIINVTKGVRATSTYERVTDSARREEEETKEKSRADGDT